MTGIDPTPSDRTRLLRGAADDALTEAERRELDAHLAQHPADASVIDFERRLRGELARAIGGEEPPDELESRIRRLAAPPRPRASRGRWLFAAAAAVLLIAALAIRNSLRRSPDEFGFDGRGELVQFLGTHPENCPITIERTLEQFHVRRFDEAVTELGALLGEAPRIDDLAKAGLEFRGMGRCGIPGHELSMHVMFTGAEGSELEGAMLSVYLQRDDGRLPIRDGATYRLEPKQPEFAALQIYVWRHDGLDYFVVTPHADAGRVALASTGAPPVSGVL